MKNMKVTRDGYMVEVNDLANATKYVFSKGNYFIVAQLTTGESGSEIAAYMVDEYGTEELFAVMFEGRYELITAIEETRDEFEYIRVYDVAREPLAALLVAFEQWAREHVEPCK